MFEFESVCIPTFVLKALYSISNLMIHHAFMIKCQLDIEELLLIDYIDIGIPFVDFR
jgi:hypothetical protein